MNIGIIDADLLDNGTRHPNLALMKISGYYKNAGHHVELITKYESVSAYERIYVSKVFTFTQIPECVLTLPNVVIGGTGFFPDGGDSLPDEIEHHMPDYNLYKNYIEEQIQDGKSRVRFADYLDFSIGFTTRGCFRKCAFCVNKKYNKAIKHSPISEFINQERPYIYLWDDNFLAFSGWEDVLNKLEATGKPFQFRQGLDIRLMTERIAQRLSNTRYYGDFIFAFDHIQDRELIERKLRLWRRYSAKTTKLYVLCAYESQDEEDIIRTFERIKILMKYGCLPYIMRYENYKNSDLQILYTQLARWCNQPQFFKKKSFRQFCEANQAYHKNSETTCAAYQSMIDFERQYPETARKYFDLRFDQENEYSSSFGYGRKYTHKKGCDECAAEQKMWIEAYQGKMDNEKLLVNYFTKEMDMQCLVYRNIKCNDVPKEEIAAWFCDMLLNVKLIDIIRILKGSPLENVLPSNIPQYSQMGDAIHSVLDILLRSGKEDLTFDEIGYYLDGKEKNEVAQRKYGENHSKFAALLDLTSVSAPNNVNHISLSVLGHAYCNLSTLRKEEIVARLAFRIPIIQHIFINALDKDVIVSEYMHGLSEQTKKRRKPNVVDLINFLKKYETQEMEVVFDHIKER